MCAAAVRKKKYEWWWRGSSAFLCLESLFVGGKRERGVWGIRYRVWRRQSACLCAEEVGFGGLGRKKEGRKEMCGLGICDW